MAITITRPGKIWCILCTKFSAHSIRVIISCIRQSSLEFCCILNYFRQFRLGRLKVLSRWIQTLHSILPESGWTFSRNLQSLKTTYFRNTSGSFGDFFETSPAHSIHNPATPRSNPRTPQSVPSSSGRNLCPTPQDPVQPAHSVAPACSVGDMFMGMGHQMMSTHGFASSPVSQSLFTPPFASPTYGAASQIRSPTFPNSAGSFATPGKGFCYFLGMWLIDKRHTMLIFRFITHQKSSRSHQLLNF